MWICNSCGKENGNDRVHCWSCPTPKDKTAVMDELPPSPFRTHDVPNNKTQVAIVSPAASQPSEPINASSNEHMRKENPAAPRSSLSAIPAASSGLKRGNPLNDRRAMGTAGIVIGVVLLIIGPVLMWISPTLIWTSSPDGIISYETTNLTKEALFFGFVLLIFGVITCALGFGLSFTSTQPTPPAPTTQPIGVQSFSPKSVELGNTSDEVQSVIGHPDKIINLGARVIHVYKDMKIIYIDGKVSDVQL